MVLKFFGRDSGFDDDNTSAYFITKSEMVLIDCPASTFFKLKKMDLSCYEKIYVLVTHTHSDHMGCLGLFVQYAYFELKKSIEVVAPSIYVATDIARLLRIEGVNPLWCQIKVYDVWKNDWFEGSILTDNLPKLKSEYFGYYLIINNTHVIYMGDTLTLMPFKDLINEVISNDSKRKNCEIYVNASVYNDDIHLKLKDALDELKELTKSGIKVYLMHIDDIEAAKIIIKDIPNVEVVPVV